MRLNSILALAAAAAASPTSDYLLKEHHPAPPAWTESAIKPAANRMLKLKIGLKQAGYEKLEQHLTEISDPDHPRFREHLSQEDIQALTAPSEESSSLVREWLESHGIAANAHSLSPGGDWVTIHIPVSKAEQLLNTKYSVYNHEDGSQVVRTPQWSLPRHLHEHIDTIQPTNSFFGMTKKASFARQASDITVPNTPPQVPPPMSVDDACMFSDNKTATTPVTPYCLRALYGITDYEPQSKQNSAGWANYLGENTVKSDMVAFMASYKPDALAYAAEFEVDLVNGAKDMQVYTPEVLKSGHNVEANLDGGTILSLTYPTRVKAVDTAGKPPRTPEAEGENQDEPYLQFVEYALRDREFPLVFSTSYGEPEYYVPESYQRRVCQEFGALTARGTTLLFSAGDSGVSGLSDNKCMINGQRRFTPSFPSGCVWVTNVGGVHSANPTVVAYDPRNGYSDGAGFSDVFKRPSWQNEAVEKYLPKIPQKFDGLYNKQGRAYPDISCESIGFVVKYNGQSILVDGTSASSPTCAAVLANVNDALLTAHKRPLGFLNPWLYKQGYKGFDDLPQGRGSTLGCNTDGFQTEDGWDAATGWGTPQFSKLLSELGVDPKTCPGCNGGNNHYKPPHHGPPPHYSGPTGPGNGPPPHRGPPSYQGPPHHGPPSYQGPN